MTPIEYIQKVRQCADIEFLKAEVIAMQGVMIGQHAALSDISVMLASSKPEPDDVKRALNLATRSAAAFRYPDREFPSTVAKPTLVDGNAPPVVSTDVATAPAAEIVKGNSKPADDVDPGAGEEQPVEEQPIDEAETKKALDAIAAASAKA